ncbi:hypothetical protein [uncultured Tenacibaculum sp.]|uniref:hypothetical protein n=1 Tax=uncultured Tenacibaculum sp. TaxID=174713 RepID=UPI0026296865|nr:hypothetical protein [uncultured Tenacibaculum sp.]
MICALCKEKEATKKNTHYLSDGVIRKCLNIGGTNERERGYYFDISNGNPFVEFNFQRIDEVNLEKGLGRPPTDEELENARKIPFSVDYVFCNTCEKSFTEFESKFSSDIIPKLRNVNLNQINHLNFEEVSLIRMFFYIQIWRNAICEEIFSLSPKVEEELRLIILNKQVKNINHFPLMITYLETLGGDMSFTENYVGSTSDRNPNVIFMNDFVVQFFDDIDYVKYNKFYGLNDEVDFKEFVNFEEEVFKVKVLSNIKRKELLSNIINTEKVKQTLSFLEKSFDLIWQRMFYGFPPIQIKQEYIHGIIGDDDFTVLKYSQKQIAEYTEKFIWDRIRR